MQNSPPPNPLPILGGGTLRARRSLEYSLSPKFGGGVGVGAIQRTNFYYRQFLETHIEP
ncbi:MAG: hypothetical protein AAF629_19945 [Chloroflexota bacterium]